MAAKVAPLETSIEILATPATVWGIVSDLRRMTDWSPELVFQKFTGSQIGLGTRSINLNKRKGFVWPTSSKVTVFEPEKRISFFVHGSSAQWTYELEPTTTGTKLTERRDLKGGRRSLASKVTAAVALGGIESHDVELIEGMNKTLARIKGEAESV
ncbi:MAG: SRPBCC family protein [Actinomycetota bacterium]|nr:SRPBCC family protein [Actinomycetota bacterium]